MGGGHREIEKCERREIFLAQCFMKKIQKRAPNAQRPATGASLRVDSLPPLGFRKTVFFSSHRTHHHIAMRS